ncbi:hypothetical protein F5Y07DRAFT_403572 [Xylaria sp. FL0933]|nr:hypothetical protein F5Y07DRAFT_403572 [Xylaria sp. FL0933]
MSDSAYTIVIHGNDTIGKSTLGPALRAAGEIVYARGDEDPTLEDTLLVRTFDKLTLQLADDDHAPLPESYTDKDGVHRRIVRNILDADLPRPSSAARGPPKHRQELAAFYGLPVVDTGKKGVDETASSNIALTRNSEILAPFSMLALRTLTPNNVSSLVIRRAVIPGCGLRPAAGRDHRHRVRTTTIPHDANAPLRLCLVVEGESKQSYKVETPLTRHFDNHVLVFLKPTMYSHGKQAAAEITDLNAIRATGSRLFLEMLHRAGISHTC